MATRSFKVPRERIDGTPENIWCRALFDLWRNDDPTRLVEAFRNHVPLHPYYYDQLADFHDPVMAKKLPGILAWKKNGNFSRRMRSRSRLIDIGKKVLDAEHCGEKKEAVVARMAKQTGLSLRRVWAAAKSAKEAGWAPLAADALPKHEAD